MPNAEPAGGLASSDFRQAAQVNGLKRTPGTAPGPDPMDQVLADARKRSAIKLMDQQDKSADVELLKVENDRLKAEIEQQQLIEARGGPQAANANPWQEYMLRKTEALEAELRSTSREATAAQQAVLEDRLHLLTEELNRVKTPGPERDEFESAMGTVDKALTLAERLRPPAPAIVDRGPDPGLERFLATLEADREARRFEAQERQRNQEIDLQLKREALAREEARLDKQAASQERFVTDTVPKILTLGQQLVETVIARFGAPAPGSGALAPNGPTPVPAAVRAAMAAPAVPEAPLPGGVLAMACSVCQTRILYRPGWPEVICSHCGASYRDDAPPDDPGTPEDAPLAAPNREESDESAPESRFDPRPNPFESDPALPP